MRRVANGDYPEEFAEIYERIANADLGVEAVEIEETGGGRMVAAAWVGGTSHRRVLSVDGSAVVIQECDGRTCHSGCLAKGDAVCGNRWAIFYAHGELPVMAEWVFEDGILARAEDDGAPNV
jgi:hypothetical protein